MLKYEYYCPDCQRQWESHQEEPDIHCPQCGSYSVQKYTSIKCGCGDTVELTDFTNECENCGTLYNKFGQKLKPMSEWAEDF